jgi:hypothetical protein
LNSQGAGGEGTAGIKLKSQLGASVTNHRVARIKPRDDSVAKDKTSATPPTRVRNRCSIRAKQRARVEAIEHQRIAKMTMPGEAFQTTKLFKPFATLPPACS